MVPEQIPYFNGDILRRWIEVPEIFHVQVKVPVVVPLDDLFPDQLVEILKVYDITSFRIYRTGHFDHQVIIVPMVVLIVAFAEHLFVFFIAPVRVVKAVRGIEMGLAAGSNDLR